MSQYENAVEGLVPAAILVLGSALSGDTRRRACAARADHLQRIAGSAASAVAILDAHARGARPALRESRIDASGLAAGESECVLSER